MNHWLLPPASLSLAGNEVHIWKASLLWNCTQPLYALLAPDEQTKAERFHFDRDRSSYIVGRGLLRLILSVYLSVDPKDLTFEYNRYGKPRLASDLTLDDRKELQFNVSHSHTLALYAIAWNTSVGVDLEYLRPELDWRQIAEHYFSPREVAALAQVSETQQCRAFFDCWTRKEAYIKAKGQGLSIPLDQFDVSLKPGEPAALIEVRNHSQEVSRWTIRELRPDAAYAAAIAMEGEVRQLCYWQASPQLWLLDPPHFRPSISKSNPS
jgi:4'-phosphopantetheinyl transferase